MIRFTIITITYNAENLLPHTLESVWEQTHEAVEHIIVDGASKDNTATLAREYVERHHDAHTHHTARMVSEPDRGLYDAMNKGLAMAQGDYLLFLNAGDAFHGKDTLAKVAATADSGSELPAVVYGDTVIVDGSYRYLRPRHFSVPKELSWRSFSRGMVVCHQAFYARTDIARTVSYDLRYRYSADVDWCIRVMKIAEQRGLPLRNVHGVVAEYLEEGETTRHHRASLRERFRVMACHYGWLHTTLLHLKMVARKL